MQGLQQGCTRQIIGTSIAACRADKDLVAGRRFGVRSHHNTVGFGAHP